MQTIGSIQSQISLSNTSPSQLQQTPISSAEVFVPSSGSENVLELLDTPSRTIDTPSRPSTEYLLNCTTLNDCPQCRDFESNRQTTNDTTAVSTAASEASQLKTIDSQDRKWTDERVKSPVVENFVARTEIDSTSFIILRDDDKTTKVFDTMPEKTLPRDRCNDCCFCNPNLHKSGDLTARSCNFCSRKKTSSNTFQETETKGTNTTHVYERVSRMDHTHVRTRSKDSDTVSLKCSRTSSRIRRFVPEDRLNGNVDDTEKPMQRPKNVNSLASKSQQSPQKSRTKLDPIPTVPLRDRSAPALHLPNPFRSSHSYDSATSSQCSSTSSSPGTPKKCPRLPTNRWQQSSGQRNHAAVTVNKTRASRYQEFYGRNPDGGNSTATQSPPDAEKGVLHPAVITQQSSGK